MLQNNFASAAEFLGVKDASAFLAASSPRHFLAPVLTLLSITNVVNVISTFPGLWAIDRLGRRPVLFYGALGMGISQYIVAACGVATAPDNNASAAAQFAFICVFIFFFASTWGPGAWVVTGEMFPLKVRAKCLSMTTASNVSTNPKPFTSTDTC